MDELEELCIEMYSTVAPKGYNIMATSWRNLGSDLAKKRMHTEDDDLPKYISRIREEGRRSGFSVYDPRSGRTRVVRGKKYSLAEKLDIAKKWLAAIQEDGYQGPQHKGRAKAEDDGLPPYIFRRSGLKRGWKYNGYLVAKPGFKSKQFFGGKMSMHQKLQLAVEYSGGLKDGCPEATSSGRQTLQHQEKKL